MRHGVLDIGDVVRQSGLPASTLRFYEEKGLIESVGRNGLRRVYDAGVLELLALITLGRNAGFSLSEIASLFTAGGLDIDRERLLDKADQLDRKIKQFTAMRDGLRHAAKCPAPSHLECPTFTRMLNAANKDQIRRRGRRAERPAQHCR